MSHFQASRKVLVQDSAAAATQFVAGLFETIVCEAVDQRGICYLALAGGTTPRRLYQHLAAEGASDLVPWDKVEVFLGDERDVPHDHVESNYCMIQRTLLDHVPIVPSSVHPMPADASDLASAAVAYEQVIRQAVPAGPQGLPQFDLILLGMGGDGHVASLFPNTDALTEPEKLVTACFVPVLGRNRMTFTFALLNASRNVVMLVTGPDKAEAVAGVLNGNEQTRRQLPGASVDLIDGVLFMVLDAAAAALAQIPPQSNEKAQS